MYDIIPKNNVLQKCPVLNTWSKRTLVIGENRKHGIMSSDNQTGACGEFPWSHINTMLQNAMSFIIQGLKY